MSDESARSCSPPPSSGGGKKEATIFSCDELIRVETHSLSGSLFLNSQPVMLYATVPENATSLSRIIFMMSVQTDKSTILKRTHLTKH